MNLETKKRATEHVRQVHELLQEMLRAAGHGMVSGTEAALGLRRGYIGRQRTFSRLDLGTLLVILEQLNINPAAFFRELYPGDEPPASAPDPDPSDADTEDLNLDPADFPETGVEEVLLRRRGYLPPDEDDTL